jgi:hypothetical protein
VYVSTGHREEKAKDYEWDCLHQYPRKKQVEGALQNAGAFLIEAREQYSMCTYKFNLNTKNIFSNISAMTI